MSALISRKQFLLLPLVAVLLIGAYALFKSSGQEAAVENTPNNVLVEQVVPVAATQLVAAGLTVTDDAHPADCSHCNTVNTDEEVTHHVLTTRPNLDYIFKGIAAQGDVTAPRSAFDLTGSQKGQHVSLNVGDLELSGTVTAVLEDPNASAYAIKLEDNLGRLIVEVDGNDAFSGQVLLFGDSRALTIRDHRDRSDIPMLIVEETTISDLYCAPRGTIYTDSGLQPTQAAGNEDPLAKAYAPLVGIADAIPLDSLPGAEFVIYLDFDGEEVTDPRWNGGDLIDAQPHPKANDDAFVTSVWQRAAEDFAPFDITVTTDLAVYNAADVDKRLHVVITPTDDAAPGAGGVAGLFSFRGNSPIVWVFNLSEYTCATTISHEAGHAFGLFHDGKLPTVTYYPGHNDGYTPGWGAIMGAPFSGGFYDEVDQWSKGEYAGADNQEDDLAILGGTRNGFGYKADDYPDVIGGGSGILNTIGVDLLGGSGLISRSFDVDVFRFASTDGDISFTVSPLDVDSSDSQPGSSTQGANLAAQITLLDSMGVLVATGLPDGATELGSKVEATITAGIYYIAVEGTGRGADASVGFSDYASLGAYSVVGNLPAPPLSVTGGEGIYKNANAVLLGDLETQVENGTNYGFSYVANGPIVHTFYLTNTDMSEITNLSVSLATGDDFYIENSPRTSIDGEATDFSLRIAYDPNDNSGKHTDTVTITYDAAETEIFEFAISGTSTQSATEDNYETNNHWYEAYNLNSVEDTWLSDHRGEAFFKSYYDDFYTFNVNIGDLVTVEIDYDAAEGPVTFELFNKFFDPVLRSTTDESGIMQFVVPNTFTTTGHRTFYIKASLPDDNRLADTSYDLRWSSRSLLGVGGDDDFYEENDSMAEATNLGSASNTRLSEYLGEGISNDEDWYKVQIPVNPYYRMLYVEAIFEHTEGNIDIEVMDESGNLLISNAYPVVSESENDIEIVTVAKDVFLSDYLEPDRFVPDLNYVMGLEPGFYYIRVYGDFAGNSYDLLIEPRIEDNYEVVTIDPTGESTEEVIFNDSRVNPAFLGDRIFDQWLSNIKGPGTLAAYTSDPDEVSDLFDPDLDSQFTVSDETDWYEFTVRPLASGERVEFIQIEYTSVGVELPNLPSIKLEPESTTDGSPLTGEDAASSLMGSSGVLTLPVKSSYSATYLISLVADHPHEYLTGYDFKVTLIPESSVNLVDDNYEQNDNFQELFDLRNNAGLWLTAVDGYGVQLDPDWYEISIPEGAGQVTVSLTSDSSVGNVDLTLSKKDGNKVFESLDGGNTETIIWDDPIPGAYAVTVTGDRVGNQYNLFWDVVLEDDNYEENDERLAAADLSSSGRTWLRKLDGPGVQRDEDWYKINVPASAAVLDIRTNFDPTAGDIDLELYNANGYLIARSISTTDVESLTYSSPASGDYYIQIHYGNAGNEYDLWWGAFTQEELDSVVEDAYEENDTTSAAYVLAEDQVWLTDLLGLATQTDDDWFEVTVAEGNIGLDVDVIFTHADGDIDVEVYDALGSIITRSESLTDNESINYNAPLPAGTYQIRVYGANVANEYDLYWVDRNEDVFELNNTRETAYNLSNDKQFYISQIGVPTQGDDDWYQIETLVDNSTIVVDLIYSHVNGDVNLELYDQSGTLITDSMTTEDFEYIQQLVSSAGIYYVRVWGDNNHTDYDLFWNAQPEDTFEENDAFLAAEDISSDESVSLAAVAFDDEWFVITPPLGAVSLQVDLAFSHGAGDLNIEVYDSNENLIGSETSDTDNETLVVPVNPFGGQYYFRVFHPERDYGNTYTLTWTSSTTDAYEGNNSLEDAFDLTAFEGELLSNSTGFATSKDEDWYRIDVTGSDLAVNCLFKHSEGDIDIELYDANGVFVARSISDTDDEFIIQAITSGTYYIRVFGDLAGNAYDLIWSTYGADDGFEVNNDLASAADLTGVEFETTSDLVQLDEDWFEVAVENIGDRLIVECDFGVAVGSLELSLYDSGEVLLATAVSADGLDRVDLSGLAVGSYFARVTGANVGSMYSLRWSSGVDDTYEENDTLAVPYDYSTDAGVALSGLAGLASQYDEDWYRVVVAADGSTLDVRLSSTVTEGVLSLAIYDSLENALAASSAGGDMSLFLHELTAGIYFIQVSGPEIGTEYDLVWNDIADDNYENNDTLAEAYDLASTSGTLSLIDGSGIRIDDDFYRVDSFTDAVRLQVDCLFTHADGDIALTVLDEDGAVVGTVDTADDNETLTVTILPDAAAYYILVDSAENSGASYDLSWSIDGVDSYESNNDLASASDLSAAESILLSDVNGFGTQHDEDWYLVSVPLGSAEILNVELTFTHANGNINLEVRNSASAVLAVSNSLNDIESVSVAVNEADGDYYIVVSGDNAGNSYDLIWSLIVDDNYEENDNDTVAYDLTGDEGVALLSVDGLGTQLDEDWFVINTPVNSIAVEVTLFDFLNAEGDLNLEVLDSTLTSVVISAGVDDTETVSFATNPAGETYYIRVYGDNAANTYDLIWNAITEDAYEPNNFVEFATVLFFDEGVWLDQVDGYATQFEDDWYAVVVSDTSINLNIQCQFTHADGDIDLELYQFVATPLVERDDPNADERKPVLLTREISSTALINEEVINFPVTEAGIYFIRVYFGNGGNAYNLLWDDGVDGSIGDAVYINDYLNGTWVYTPRNNLATALLASPSANEDGDTLTNWEEYALGLDPSIQDYVVVGQSIAVIDGEDYFQFEFLRRKEAVAFGFEFIVEESGNMIFDGSTAEFVRTEDVDSEIERVFYRGSRPMDLQSQCFFRLVVKEPVVKK